MIKLVVNIRESATLPTKIQVYQFDEVNVNLKFDSICSTFKLKLYFDPLNETHAELAAVSHIHECQVFYVHDKVGTYATSEKNGQPIFQQTAEELIITGFILAQKASDGANPSFMELGGYSKAGVLQECDFPTKAYPLETEGLSLRQIIQTKILPYFVRSGDGGFRFYVKSTRADSIFTNDDANNKDAFVQTKIRSRRLIGLSDMIDKLDKEVDFDLGKVTSQSGNNSTNMLSFLKDLAVQKDLILSTDIFGNLIVNAGYSGTDYLFEIGTGNNEIKCIDMQTSYNGQALHSDIEAQIPTNKDGGNEGYAIVKNPLVPIVYRPKVITVNQGTDNDCELAAMRALRTELGAVTLVITLDRAAVKGKFIMPNNTILVKNPKCYLYQPSIWFIEEVVYEKDSNGDKCVLTCVLPGVYSGEIKNPFVNPNENLGQL